jgi:hypothetical protein
MSIERFFSLIFTSPAETYEEAGLVHFYNILPKLF